MLTVADIPSIDNGEGGRGGIVRDILKEDIGAVQQGWR
jgi:hypothetical protein